jgi:hypothetical protein
MKDSGANVGGSLESLNNLKKMNLEKDELRRIVGICLRAMHESIFIFSLTSVRLS